MSSSNDSASSAIAAELAARELARRRLVAFILRMKPDYLPGWFHYDLAARLERFVRRVERGESPRLLLSVPPGHGKSELVSRALPAWALGHHPDWHFLAASHTGDLANDMSLDVINYLRSAEYQTVFPNTAQRADKKGIAGWRTTMDGRYTPLGVGAGISGRRAHILIIDDPHKDQEAYSKAIRDSVDKWYTTSASTRLFPGGGIIIIQCVAEGERVFMADGAPPRPIEEVKPGDRVLSFDKELNKIVTAVVSAARCSGEDNILEVATDRAKLRVNARHPFLVIPSNVETTEKRGKPRWVQAQDIAVGDIVVTAFPDDDEPRLDRVRSVVDTETTARVYDLTVPGNDNFVVESFVTHNTRWAMDDLIGRRIASEGVVPQGVWELVEYPCEAIDDEYRLADGRIVNSPPENLPRSAYTLLRRRGELLHPERWPEELLKPHRKNIHTWQALFQQHPTAEGAGFIDIGKLVKNVKVDLPDKENLSYLAAGDMAMSAKEKADWSVLTTGAIDRDGDLWIVDMMRGKYLPSELVDKILDTYETYRHDLIGIEKTQHTIGLEPFMDHKIEERGLHQFPLELISHGNKDKQLRAQPFRGMVEEGRVHVLTDMPYYEDLMRECGEFPGGAHDDIVDTLAYLGQMVNDVAPNRRKKTEAPKRKDAWGGTTVENRLAQLSRQQNGLVKDWRTA